MPSKKKTLAEYNAEKADRRADMNYAARLALLDAMHRMGQGMGEKLPSERKFTAYLGWLKGQK